MYFTVKKWYQNDSVDSMQYTTTKYSRVPAYGEILDIMAIWFLSEPREIELRLRPPDHFLNACELIRVGDPWNLELLYMCFFPLTPMIGSRRNDGTAYRSEMRWNALWWDQCTSWNSGSLWLQAKIASCNGPWWPKRISCWEICTTQQYQWIRKFKSHSVFQ